MTAETTTPTTDPTIGTANGRTTTIVAVDGPSGSGKSSVSRRAAKELGFHLLDTGAAYRALAWLALDRDVDLEDGNAVAGILGDFERLYAIALEPDESWVRVGEHDVTDAIRETSISSVVSKVARVPEVRTRLNDLFRRILAADDAPGIVAEGRDITTVVAPDAHVRVLLTADEATRIARRAGEKAGEDAAAVAASVTARDRQDSQVVDFLSAADGVTVLDSTHLSYDETVAAMIDLMRHGANDPKEQA